MYTQVPAYGTVQALPAVSQGFSEGTLAYVSERGGELYVRTLDGWRKIQVGVVIQPHTIELLLYFYMEQTYF